MSSNESRTLIGVSSTLMGVGALWYLIAEAIAAFGFPGYSYSSNYISDLGIPEAAEFYGRAIDSRLSIVMNAGFLGQGLMMILGGTLLFWALPPLRAKGLFLTLAVLHGFGVALVGLVHGSPVNEAAGFMVFHSLGAMLAIGCGNAAVILAGVRTLRPLLGPRLSRASIILGCVGLLSVVIHLVTTIAGFVNGLGVSERLAVYSILAWQILFAAKFLAGDTGQQAGTVLSAGN